MSSTPFTHIYASPLKRAFSTAQAVLAAQSEPKPLFTVSPDVREQHFGIAEGQPWSYHADARLAREELYAKGVFPVILNRQDRFPEGESLEDLQNRTERAIREIVVPYIWKEVNGAVTDPHIAIVSHGLCISELVAAVLRLDSSGCPEDGDKWTGLMNTAWTRVTIGIVRFLYYRLFLFFYHNYFCEIGEESSSQLPPLRVKVTHVNEHMHLNDVVRWLNLARPFGQHLMLYFVETTTRNWKRGPRPSSK